MQFCIGGHQVADPLFWEAKPKGQGALQPFLRSKGKKKTAWGAKRSKSGEETPKEGIQQRQSSTLPGPGYKSLSIESKSGIHRMSCKNIMTASLYLCFGSRDPR
jgi:hypothetical protein